MNNCSCSSRYWAIILRIFSTDFSALTSNDFSVIRHTLVPGIVCGIISFPVMNRQSKGFARCLFSNLYFSRTLSEKFSKIAAQNVATTVRQTRKIVVVQEHANKRIAQSNVKRGIKAANVKPAKGEAKRAGAQKQAKRGRGGGRGGRGKIICDLN
jgi:hypothetical protein